MDADGEEEDGNECKVEDGMDDNGNPTGLEVAELHEPVATWNLNEEARGEEDEENDSDEDRPPICHFCPPFLLRLRLEDWAKRFGRKGVLKRGD